MPSLNESGVARSPSWYGPLSGNTRSIVRQAGAIILHADSAVTTVHGMAWLAEQRDASVRRRLADLRAEATVGAWSAAEVVAARLAIIRPRRSEINALGREYLLALVPGVVDAAHRIRRSGVAIGLASDVAVEALFGVATALGVTPEDIHAPTVRFDALGFFAGSDLVRGGAPARSVYRSSPVAAGCVYVGARPPEFGLHGDDAFIRYSGVVQHDGSFATPVLDTVGSFGELVTLVAG